MGIQLKPIEEKYLSEIIILLQLISNFYPKKTNYKSILNLFLNQKYVFGVVAIDSINNGNNESYWFFPYIYQEKLEEVLLDL